MRSLVARTLGRTRSRILRPLAGEGELPRPAILAVDVPVEEAILVQPLHQDARIVAVDPERFGETALVDPGNVIEEA